MNDNTELISLLRLGASISRERKLNRDYAEVADKAADALEALQAAHTDEVMRGLMLEKAHAVILAERDEEFEAWTRKWYLTCVAVDELRAENAALQTTIVHLSGACASATFETKAALARLAELEGQEPVCIVGGQLHGDHRWVLQHGSNVAKGDKLFASAGASPQPEQQSPAPTCDLRGIDAGQLSEWVDLVKHGYVAKDECLIAVKDVPKWVAQNDTQPVQPSPARDALVVNLLRLTSLDKHTARAIADEVIDAAINAKHVN